MSDKNPKPSKRSITHDFGGALESSEGPSILSRMTISDSQGVARPVAVQETIEISSIVEDHPLQKFATEFKPDSLPDDRNLLETIKEFGVNIPICVKALPQNPGEPRRFRMVYGHRRVICCKILKIKTIPALIADPSVNDLWLHILENIGRSKRPTSEQAATAKAALETEVRPGERRSKHEIAKLFGWSESWMDTLIELLNMPAPLRDFYTAGADAKLLDQVWTAIKKSMISPEDSLKVAQSLREMGIDSLPVFVSFVLKEKINPVDAIARMRSEGLVLFSKTPVSADGSTHPDVPLVRKVGRRPGSRGSHLGVDRRVLKQRFWDNVWLQRNSDEAKEILIRTTGTASTRAESLISHSAGSGKSLGMAILAAVAQNSPSSSGRSLDDKEALLLAQKLHDGKHKHGTRVTEQYLLTLSQVPDMMTELQAKDGSLFEFCARIFGIRTVGRKPAIKKKK